MCDVLLSAGPDDLTKRDTELAKPTGRAGVKARKSTMQRQDDDPASGEKTTESSEIVSVLRELLQQEQTPMVEMISFKKQRIHNFGTQIDNLKQMMTLVEENSEEYVQFKKELLSLLKASNKVCQAMDQEMVTQEANQVTSPPGNAGSGNAGSSAFTSPPLKVSSMNPSHSIAQKLKQIIRLMVLVHNFYIPMNASCSIMFRIIVF